MKEREVRQVLSMLMHMTSLPDVVEAVLEQLPRRMMDCADSKVRETFRAWLMRLSEMLASNLAEDFKAAAQKGIEEAESLIRDPDYYETVKRRRARDRAQSAEWKRQSEARREMLERHARGEYTKEEREQLIEASKYTIDYHDRMLRAEREKLLKLQSGAALLEDVGLDWGDIEDF
jgi:hypothetical protein